MKPLTLIGEGMLVTVGAVIPGGVLPPEREKKRKGENATFYSTNRLSVVYTDLTNVLTLVRAVN